MENKRKRIYEETLTDLSNKSYVSRAGETRSFPKMLKLKKSTYMYDSPGKVVEVCNFPDYCIHAEQVDPLLKAKTLGKNTIILSNSSTQTPGGGVMSGISGREEELFRRSNLAYSLYYFIEAGRALFKFKTRPEQSYPLPTFGGIWSPCVTIYKDASGKILDTPYQCNVISVGSMNDPALESPGVFEKRHEVVIKKKQQAILRIGLKNKCTTIILGDWGVSRGADPEAMIKLWLRTLEDPEFKEHYEEVCFAIPDPETFKIYKSCISENL